MAYSFSGNVDYKSNPERPFIFEGLEVSDFRPILYGGFTIQLEGTPCFGRGYINGKEYGFYKKGLKGRMRKIELRSEDNYQKVCQVRKHGRLICYYLNAEDWSPFKSDYNRHVPGLICDKYASLNYQGFLRSSNIEGFEELRKIHLENGGFIPIFARRFMPLFPRFNDPLIIECDDLNLLGHNCISRIEYKYKEGLDSTYNLADEIPIEDKSILKAIWGS